MMVALGGFAASLPFLIVVLMVSGIPRVDSLFWFGAVGTSLLNILATWLSFKALSLEDASFLAPIAAFNPVVTSIVSMFTLREFPSLFGAVGIVSIGIGALLLGRTKQKKFHTSFINLFSNKSVQYMLVCYLIWSVTPSLEKTAVLHTSNGSPVLLALVSTTLLSLGIVPFVYRRRKELLSSLQGNFGWFGVLGILTVVGEVAVFTAFTLTNVAYVTAVFKTSMVFTVLFAGVFLRERGLASRLLATAFMLVGVVLLSLE